MTGPSTSPGALVRYAAAWLLAGLAVALVAALVVTRGEEEVRVPPIRQTELTEAARAADCELRRSDGIRPLDPAVDGPAGSAAEPGVYARRPARPALIGAMRRGIVVIRYRPSLSEEQAEQLEALRAEVPAGTIVTVDGDMPYAVAATAWRRLMGCRRYVEGPTADAIRLFRGRFVGTGPDT